MENQVNKQQNNNIVKKPKKKKFWIVILIVVIGIIVCIPILLVVFIALITWIFFTTPYDVTNGSFSQCVDADICSSKEVTDYYDTVEAARDARNDADTKISEEDKFDLGDFWRSGYEGAYTFDKEVLRIEDEDAITLVSVYKNDTNKILTIDTFQKIDIKYSNDVAVNRYEVKNMITSKFLTKKGIYDFEEEIAQDLSYSCMYNQTSFANDGVMMPYGLTDSEDIYNVTIMGEEPTDIIPIDYDGTTYYFWYFDSEAIDEKIREEIQGEMTLGKVVDGLQIEVDYK